MSFRKNAFGYLNVSGLPAHGRAVVWTGPTSVTTPSAGGSIDGVAKTDGRDVMRPASRGDKAEGRAGGLISAGDDLEVQGDGDFVSASGGTVVARALESASAGSSFWMTFV